MKRIFLFLVLGAGLVSCTGEDLECNCKFGRFEAEDGVYFVKNVKINCETGQPLNPSEHTGKYTNCED